MVIVLSKSEKKSFFSFLGLYLGSSFLLISVIAVIYFNSLASSMLESQKDKMRTYAASIASNAISVHMHGGRFSYEENSIYKIAMYSNKLNLLYGEDLEGIDFTQKAYIKDYSLYVIDRSAQLHMGIDYIVLKNTTIFKAIESLKVQILLYTLVAMIFVSLIGFILSRLFLKPLAAEREKLDRFIKDTTHELNTPISALLMSVGGLKNDDSKIAKRIELSSNRISSIYDNLCYLLKGDTKAYEKPQEINLKDIIEEQILLLETYKESKSIIINTTLESVFINIDTESATRLINNLISNGLKYSKPNSTITITLDTKQLVIEDEGVGIESDKLQHIKKRFYRANESEGGFGIGLDIVDSICKRYNIKFMIESIPNKGTKVTLLF